MMKTFLFSVVSLFLFGGANAATPWWEQPTICRLSPSNCYASMGAGYLFDTSDPDSWDITSKCWGKKYIHHQMIHFRWVVPKLPMQRV